MIRNLEGVHVDRYSFLAIVKTFGYHTQYAEARGDGEHA